MDKHKHGLPCAFSVACHMFLWLTDKETHPWGRMVLPLSADVSCSSVTTGVPIVALSRSCVEAALLRFRDLACLLQLEGTFSQRTS